MNFSVLFGDSDTKITMEIRMEPTCFHSDCEIRLHKLRHFKGKKNEMIWTKAPLGGFIL